MRASKLLLSATALVAAAAFPGAASAQLGSCPLLTPMPCIVFDYKRLAEQATRNAQDIQKIQQTVQKFQAARSTAQGIVSDVKQLTSFDLNAPAADLDAGSLFSSLRSSGITKGAEALDSKLFKSGGQEDAQSLVQGTREKTARDANVSAYAYALTAPAEAATSEKRYCVLGKKMQASSDLRTDMAINSEIKMELINARARQSYLMSEFLRLQAANKARTASYDVARIGAIAGTIALKAIGDARGVDDSDKVAQMQALYDRASSIMSSLNVVQTASPLLASIQSILDDYQATIARRNRAYATLETQAATWTRKSGRGSVANTMSQILSSLNSVDAQMAALRAQPIETLDGAFRAREMDYRQMVRSDFDPRQLIGTWADPIKNKTTLAMANGLLSGVLDKTVEGDSDNDEFRKLVGDYNDVRLEEAWKRKTYEESLVDLDEARKSIAEENAKQQAQIDEQSVRAELQSIVERSNALGQEIAGGRDDGSKARASEILTRLQTLVGRGTSLPSPDEVVSSDAAPGPTTPATLP